MLNEQLLHFIWQHQLFNTKELKTTEGKRVQIVKKGILNRNAGPDFLNAQIKIGDTLWAGNVELHINTSDWIKHKHSLDDAYNNVVLHVVHTNDKYLEIPCLELNGRIAHSILDKYASLMANLAFIPCSIFAPIPQSPQVSMFKTRMLVEKLETKNARINETLQSTQNDWEACLYKLILRAFGFKINSSAFQRLSNALSYSVFKKHRHNIVQLEALLFGASGFLSQSFSDAYPKLLKSEFEHLKTKYDIDTLELHEWNFLRLRPSNFPTIRLAQLAMLYSNVDFTFINVIENLGLKDLKSLFRVSTSPFWHQHYHFNKKNDNSTVKTLGSSSIQLLIINVIAPILFAYGVHRNDETIKLKAIDLLENLPSEKNSQLEKWKEHGMSIKSSLDSQALLFLKSNYCDNKNCLNCTIGNSILRNDNVNR